MRTLLAALLAWLMPSTGKRRADTAPAHPAPKRIPWPTTQPYDGPVLRGEDVALIRPYLLAYEQQREAQRQRDRRTAAALATMGIDFLGASA
ncbi:hypothetical protein ACFYSJ_26960 [Streptomyces sp. NPDC005248]|uniref:hypothetical protein n=1 Tax=Streptomyces sp. NPDC005248 TaxID=3364709 RepID=UPI0036A71B71